MVAARVAVVTGANKGVGYHIAQSLVHSGLFSVVVLGCRDPTRGQHAAAEIGGCAEYMPLEVGNAASADAFAEALVARHGRCDVLVNNAGIARMRKPHAACRTRRAHAACRMPHTPCTRHSRQPRRHRLQGRGPDTIQGADQADARRQLQRHARADDANAAAAAGDEP